MNATADNASPASSRSSEVVRKLPPSTRVLLWICFAAWVLSFFLPAARIDIEKSGGGAVARGWELALDCIVLLVVPVKGAWLGFFPPLWTVFLNLFMLLMPLRIKALEAGETRIFTVLLSIGTAVPVALAYVPPSLGLLGLGLPLLTGFYVWEFSMILTAALFSRTLWSRTVSWLPTAVLSVLLICLPIRRAELNSTPEQPARVATTPSLTVPPEMVESIVPTTIVVDSSPNPSSSGEEVTFAARVSVPWGHSTRGTVTFTDILGNKVIGKVHTIDGAATAATSTLSVGEHGIRATFVADESNHYLSSEVSVVQTVEKQAGSHEAQ